MKIYGKIVDTLGEPLALANVTIKNGTQANKFGTSADTDGNFKLENDIITNDSVFAVSYVGYIPQSFKASELEGKTIKLLEATEELQPVVVTGKPKAKTSTSSLVNFKEHLQKHKYVYAGLGGLAGILLITSSIKK
jgi:hypothetical protein